MKKAEIYTYPSFYKDMSKLATKDVGQAFKKIYTKSGDWKVDVEDKTYHLNRLPFGVSMERKISRGARVIYIKDGHKIYLLNVGHHDKHTKGGGLTAPRDLKQNSIQTNYENLSEEGNPFQKFIVSEDGINEKGELFFSRKSPRIYEKILATLKQPMKEITFVSPFISEELFEPAGFIEKLMVKHFIGNTEINVRMITSPPQTLRKLDLLDKLELSGWKVDWCENLHSKIYIFKPNVEQMDKRTLDKSLFRDCFLIGSANLTKSGLGLHDRGNHEICENLDIALHNETDNYIKYLSKSFYTDTVKSRHRNKMKS
jgi:hypothetical protein